jgi:hypothetical protein
MFYGQGLIGLACPEDQTSVVAIYLFHLITERLESLIPDPVPTHVSKIEVNHILNLTLCQPFPGRHISHVNSRDVHWGLRADETSRQPGGRESQTSRSAQKPILHSAIADNPTKSPVLCSSLLFLLFPVLIDGVQCGVPSHPSRSFVDYCRR